MRYLAILTVKNEGAFLLEWLAHHQAVGFTDFLVFSNDCSDGTDLMLDRLEALGVLTHQGNPGPWPQGAQWAALKQADRHPLCAAADWILVCDIDEFVNIHTGARTLPALLAALPEATAIPLTWRLFGNDGVIAFDDRPITAQFQRAAPAVMGWPWRAAQFKTLFRNDGTYRKLGVHRPRNPAPDGLTRQRWFDGSGRELSASYHEGGIFSAYGQDNYGLVQMNHYALGAMESYVLKCDRGRANRDAAVFDMSYWVERNFCTDEDRSILTLAPERHKKHAALMNDTALARLHAASVRWRHERFATLMLEEPFRALLGRLLLAPPSQPLSAKRAQRMAALGRQAAKARLETMARNAPD
ncbi:glycosyltransferase family 2 protein [Phaeovulum sp.]|uniref:glycosyltransferase family 2 protein n=1 Tax=Phaeovulum sp. TaxID=2934796 RepID=UPI0039E71DA5